MSVIVKQPETPEEFEQYYDLRWRILRAPWNEPRGSEKDDIEEQCHHLVAMHDDSVVGAGRLQFNSDTEAQIRYMAVEPSYERRGIGRLIVGALEKAAKAREANQLVLDAREPAVGFYEQLGYRVTGKSYVLFNVIQHYSMLKILD